MNIHKNKNKGKLLLAIFILSLISFTISKTNSNPENHNEEDFSSQTTDLKNPILSDFWDEKEVNFIHIRNDNWSAVDLDWIQNNTGTWDDPHIIENITINAGKFGIGIFIEDSSEHFIIQNCTISNSTNGVFNTGSIYLKNANNGTIFDNSLSYNNGSGLILNNVKNITVSNNFLATKPSVITSE